MEENIEKAEDASESGSDSGSVNPQITDAVTQPNVKVLADAQVESDVSAPGTPPRHRRQEKVGLVTSDKMQKTVVVRVERQVRHRKYKRYIRRRTKFMAHDEIGAHIGDIVRIVETRPLSARKRWRVVEIVQKSR
jgi:small subunit ribosomal protein S17